MMFSENVAIVLGVAVIAIMLLGWLARRRPNIAWLRHFDFSKRLSEEQRRRFRRTQNVSAAAEIFLLGVAIPIGYVVLTVMFFNAFTTTGIVVTAASSILCLGIGAYGVISSLRE